MGWVAALFAISLLSFSIQEKGGPPKEGSGHYVWCEEGYLVNTAWIKYIDVKYLMLDSWCVKVHSTSGSSCYLKKGFRSEEEAREWLLGTFMKKLQPE
jgi:hypothetical protein